MATVNSSLSFLWEYYSLGQKEWILFDYDMASKCEDAFTQNIKSIQYSLVLNNDSTMYEINFEIMKQVNKRTGYIRSIRRRELVGDHVELFKNFAKDSLKLVNTIQAKVHTDISEANEWTKYSAVARVLPRELFKHFCKHIKSLDRAVGSIVGMAVGDAVGAPLEFADVMNGDGVKHRSYYFSLLQGYNKELNNFKLKRGQWTDDAAMGFCMADSILSSGGRFDGSDCRARFHTWWHYGYCNAFRKEKELKHSIGLGGNISKSLKDCVPGVKPSDIFQAQNEDAGNGSLMRLAPIPVAFHSNIVMAREKAALSSYTTHPGQLAAECCALMAHIIVSAIHTSHTDIRAFLDEMVTEYLSIIYDMEDNSDALSKIERLLKCEEPDTSTELCWNWKMESLYIWHTITNRGNTYNGYPVLPGYFGSFCMDGLAIALWALYHTKSFDEAIERCINVLGDADSTGSIAGQIAGAFYGYTSISPDFCNNLERWDDGDAVVRGALLYYINDK
jgi:ADP-ribosylglycohydrolase